MQKTLTVLRWCDVVNAYILRAKTVEQFHRRSVRRNFWEIHMTPLARVCVCVCFGSFGDESGKAEDKKREKSGQCFQPVACK